MKNGLRLIAVAASLTMASMTVPSVAAVSVAGVQDQDHHDHDQAQHQDYSNNRYYKLGNREGYQDHQKNEQRKEHNHKFRNDDDRRAHDEGYQQGWQGQRGYQNNGERPH